MVSHPSCCLLNRSCANVAACCVQGAPTTQDFVSVAQQRPNVTVDTSMVVQRVEVSTRQQACMKQACSRVLRS
jgi:hypothetical protein